MTKFVICLAILGGLIVNAQISYAFTVKNIDCKGFINVEIYKVSGSQNCVKPSGFSLAPTKEKTPMKEGPEDCKYKIKLTHHSTNPYIDAKVFEDNNYLIIPDLDQGIVCKMVAEKCNCERTIQYR